MEIINGILVQGISELREQQLNQRDFLTKEENPAEQRFTSSLASFIIRQFQKNKDAKRNSGMQDEIFDSVRAYNGEYSPQDLAVIRQTGGSEIFINITGVKSRAAASWIRDIQLPAKEKAWSIRPTPVVDLPDRAREKLEEALNNEFSAFITEYIPPSHQLPAPAEQAAPSPDTQPQQPSSPAISSAEQFSPTAGNTAAPQQQTSAGAAQTIKEFNQAKRDVETMLLSEINKIARHEMEKMENEIADQLAEGDWAKALSDFIDDFTTFPTAFIKGPIITKDKTISYQQGQAVVSEEYIFLNKRVSAIDMYPSANSTTINDGSNIIEHCRFTPRELLDMRGMPESAGYKDAEIDKAINDYAGGNLMWLDTGIESDKATVEARGTEWEANEDIVHGLHFHGSIPAKLLREWGTSYPEVLNAREQDEFEVESILAGNYVIKCTLNKHPLKKRPYYKASYQSKPGSFWGRSLPSLMSDIQRMCNAAARALANNMGLASGPQIEIYVDRLADNGKITNIHPFKIWQLTSDPTGAGGRAIQFTQPTSNADELLKVYQEFEVRADDATGIPRYSYGNERVGGAAQTAAGLSMLLESASKAIKDCVRNIDEEVIIPRVEMQFYWNVLTNPTNFYSGDPKAVAHGSSSLTMKGAEQMRRNEFLQATANEYDMSVIGVEGRAEILREIIRDLNLSEDIIPSRLELKAKQAKDAEAQAANQQQGLQLEKDKIMAGIKATELQITGQERMHQQTQQLKTQELSLKEWIKKIDSEISMLKLDASRESEAGRNMSKLREVEYTQDKADERFNTEVALKLQRGEGI